MSWLKGKINKLLYDICMNIYEEFLQRCLMLNLDDCMADFMFSSLASFCQIYSSHTHPSAVMFCCHLQPSLKVRKVGVRQANHWFRLPDHLGEIWDWKWVNNVLSISSSSAKCSLKTFARCLKWLLYNSSFVLPTNHTSTWPGDTHFKAWCLWKNQNIIHTFNHLYSSYLQSTDVYQWKCI